MTVHPCEVPGHSWQENHDEGGHCCYCAGAEKWCAGTTACDERHRFYPSGHPHIRGCTRCGHLPSDPVHAPSLPEEHTPVSDRRVLRYQVPVDDLAHLLDLPAGKPVLKVGARQVDVVEFWMEDNGHGRRDERTFRVFGTGHSIPAGYTYVGTPEPVAGGAIVWHLYELVSS